MKRKPLLILVLAVLSIGIVAWAFWRSPAYALHELDTALKKKDLALFYRRVDLDGLYRSAVDALAIKKLSEAERAPDLVDKVGSQLAAGFGKLASSPSLGLIKHELEIELQRDRSQVSPLARNLERNSLRLFFHDIRSIDFDDWVPAEKGVLINSRVALLKMAKTYPLTLLMTQAESGQWRISGFEGLSSLLVQYEADRQRKVDEHNQGFQALARERLPFFGETRVESDTGGLSSSLHLECLFQNKFDAVVSEVEGTIRDRAERPIVNADFHSQKTSIKPGEKSVFLIKKEQFLSPANGANGGLPLDFSYRKITFADGRSLGTVQDFDEI